MPIIIDTIFDTQRTGDESASIAMYAEHWSPARNYIADRWIYATEGDSPGNITSDLIDEFVNSWARGVSGLLTPVPIAVFNFKVLDKQIAGGVYQNGSFALRRGDWTEGILASLSIDRQTAIAHGFPPPHPVLNQNTPS